MSFPFDTTHGRIVREKYFEGDTGPASDLALGFRGIPLRSVSANASTILTDAGGGILHPDTDDNARTITIDQAVAYPVSTAITFVNLKNTVSIALSSGTLILAGTGPSPTTGTRTMAANSIATAVKVSSTKWMISGAGLT